MPPLRDIRPSDPLTIRGLLKKLSFLFFAIRSAMGSFCYLRHLLLSYEKLKIFESPSVGEDTEPLSPYWRTPGS